MSKFIIRSSEVHFGNPKTALGRNGESMVSALIIERFDDDCKIGFRNSKGVRGVGYIGFPIERINEVIQALKHLKDQIK